MFAETLVPACAYSSHRLNHCHSRAPISLSLSKSAIDCFSLSLMLDCTQSSRDFFMWNWPMAWGKEETAVTDSTPSAWPRLKEMLQLHTDHRSDWEKRKVYHSWITMISIYLCSILSHVSVIGTELNRHEQWVIQDY